MGTHQLDEGMIREYLLGRLDAQPDLADRMTERMLSDAGFSELVDVVEDEIIEEYLEGMLASADRQAVEKHFLGPPERREKLRLARLLNRDLELRGRDLTLNPETKVSPPPGYWRSHFRTYAELAACAVLIASVVYIANLRRELQSGVAQNSQELAKEHDHLVQLEKQLQSMREIIQPSVVTLSLLQPGLRRADEPLPELAIGPATRSIHVEITLRGTGPGPYDVRLETSAGKTIWSKPQQWPFRSQNQSLLMFDVPMPDLAAGDYQLVVSQPSVAGGASYLFHVSRP